MELAEVVAKLMRLYRLKEEGKDVDMDIHRLEEILEKVLDDVINSKEE